MISWRSELRKQIKEEDISFNTNEKIYLALEGNNIQLKQALEEYKEKYKRSIYYKDINLEDVILILEINNNSFRSLSLMRGNKDT